MGIFSRLMPRAVLSYFQKPRRRPERRTPRPRLEELESRLLLHANVVLDAEHLAVFGSQDATTGVVTGGLVPDAAVNYRSFATGNWSDDIWLHNVNGSYSDDGTRPGTGANVVISASTAVTLNGTTAALRTLRDDGTFAFDPAKNTILTVDTLIVMPQGNFQMGTADQRIDSAHSAKVIFVSQMSSSDRLLWDPLQFSLGMVSHGDVSIYGSTTTSFVAVPTALPAKTLTFDLGSVPIGWEAGDRLIITGNTAANAQDQNQDEQLAIASINGSVVTLSAPLSYNHGAGSAYVADVSRNAVFESDPAIFSQVGSQYVGSVMDRGHVMFMHNDDVNVDSAGFYGLGRTDKRTLIDDPVLVPDLDHPGQMTTDILLKDPNPTLPADIAAKYGAHRVLVPQLDSNGDEVLDAGGNPVLVIARTGLNARGRYAVHFHRTGVTPGAPAATITGSAVVDSPGWGIVNHSSNVDVSDNVVFNAVGAAYVTEAGDEIGSFNHNIAIHSQGSGDGIESRKQVQDFGHQGDGFWLQGGNVSVTNNVVSGQRHAGYVFFPVGLDQKGLGVTTIAAANLANPAWANGNATVADGDVPLREFKGNIAFASGDAFESWFSLLNVTDGRESVIEDFSAWGLNSGTGMFDPYTNQMTFKNVNLRSNLSSPGGTAFGRNNVTRNLTYDHVNIQGWKVGIDAPVNGVNEVIGGTFNNLKNIDITTTNSLVRVVNIHDANPADTVTFLDNLTYKDKAGVHARTQWDIFLHTNFNPMDNDITTNFNPDIVRIGLVSINGAQVYYKEQGADFTPFPSADHLNDPKFGPQAAPFVPNELKDKTNADLFAQYGLAIGGIVAPADAVDGTAQHVNGLIGAKLATYQTDVKLVSAKYTNKASYTLSYKYLDTATGKYKTVKETAPVTLHSGWNLLTRQIAGATRTLLVYGDFTPPTFVFNPDVLRPINRADIDNGATFVISGTILDDSFGKRHFELAVKLNDPKYFSPIHKDANNNDVVTLTFTIKDFAGNMTTVTVDLLVSYTAILTKDVGRKDLPTIQASTTLIALLGGP